MIYFYNSKRTFEKDIFLSFSHWKCCSACFYCREIKKNVSLVSCALTLWWICGSSPSSKVQPFDSRYKAGYLGFQLSFPIPEKGYLYIFGWNTNFINQLCKLVRTRGEYCTIWICLSIYLPHVVVLENKANTTIHENKLFNHESWPASNTEEMMALCNMYFKL